MGTTPEPRGRNERKQPAKPPVLAKNILKIFAWAV